MRRTLIALALLLCVISAWAEEYNVPFKPRAAAGGSCTNTSILTWWRAEGTTHATGDYPSSTTTWTLNGSAVIDAAAGLVGTNGLLVDFNGVDLSYASIPVSSDDRLDDAQGRIGFKFKFTSGGTPWPASRRLFYVRPNSLNEFGIIMGSADAKLTIYWESGGSAQVNTTTASTVLTADVEHFIELAWDSTQTAGSDRLELFVDNVSVLGGSTQTMSALGAAPTAFWMGNSSTTTTSTYDWYFDNVIVSSDPTKDLYSCRDETAYP